MRILWLRNIALDESINENVLLNARCALRKKKEKSFQNAGKSEKSSQLKLSDDKYLKQFRAILRKYLQKYLQKSSLRFTRSSEISRAVFFQSYNLETASLESIQRQCIMPKVIL